MPISINDNNRRANYQNTVKMIIRRALLSSRDPLATLRQYLDGETDAAGCPAGGQCGVLTGVPIMVQSRRGSET